MAFVFFAVMLLLCEIAFFVGKKDILSPFFITCAVFALSALAFAMNYFLWDMPFGLDTMLILLLGIGMFGVGSIAASYRLKKSDGRLRLQTYGGTESPISHGDIKISTRAVLILSEIVLITDIWATIDTYHVSILAGNERGLRHMLPFARQILMYTTIDFTPTILKQLKYLSMAIAFFFLFIFLYDFFYRKKRPNFLHLLPAALEVVQLVLTTGRMGFMRFMIFIVLVAALLYRKRCGFDTRILKKLVLYVGIAGVLFLIVFRLYGFMVGKSSKFGFYDNISLYLGGDLPAFDNFLHTPHSTRSGFGTETLTSIARILKKLGLIDTYSVSSLEWTTVYGMGYNTYTAFRRYLHDFGLGGLAIMEAALGYFYTRFYLFTVSKSKSAWTLLIYGIIFYPVILQFDDELFFTSVVTTGVFCQLLYVTCLFWFFIGRRGEQPKWLRQALQVLRKKTYFAMKPGKE